jgi:hypothetical protein
MNSTSSITQNFTLNVDRTTECSDESGRKSIYLNVSKVYEKLDTFVFQSTLEIKCDNVYYLKIQQTGYTKYHLTDATLRDEELQAAVNSLFADTLASLEDFRERDNARRQDSRVPAISLPTNLLANYFSSANYQDLRKSSRIVTVG